MNRVAKFTLIAFSVLSALACNLPGQPTDTGAVNPPPATPVPAEPTGVGGPAGGGAAGSMPAAPEGQNCPWTTLEEGQALINNVENGYCFLYPASYTAPADEGWVLRSNAVVGTPNIPPERPQSEAPAVYIRVTYAGADDGTLTPRQYAERTMNASLDPSYPNPGMTVEDISVGDQPAALLRGVPGMFGAQEAFVVTGGQRYRIFMSPELGMIPDLDAEAQASWQLVTGSLVFFEPTRPFSTIKPADVCPPATADTRQIIAEGDGYCYLAPADSQTHPLFADGVIIGPELPNNDFPGLHVSLAIGQFGVYPNGETPKEAASGLYDTYDPSTIKDITIAGYPAIEGITYNGPFGHRVAIVVNGSGIAYTITMNPYDSGMYPAAVADGDRLWNTVINSLAFFTPWK